MKKAPVLAVLLLASSIPGVAAGGQGRNDTPPWLAALAPPAADSRRIRSDPNFDPVVQALKLYLDNSTQAKYDDFQGKFSRLEKSGAGDWLAVLFEVFKESRRETQAQREYWLERLEERNNINDAIQEYMRELVEESQRLNEKVRAASDDAKSKQTVRVKVQDFDVGPQAQATDADGRLITPNPASTSTRPLRREDLDNLIKDVGMSADRAQNEADKAKRSFDRWSEKSKQEDQQLLAVLRKMKESRRRARKTLSDR